jgi:hypothetical protein
VPCCVFVRNCHGETSCTSQIYEGLVSLRKPWPNRFPMLDLLYENAQRIVVGVYHCCTPFRMSASNFHLTSVYLPCITFTQRM